MTIPALFSSCTTADFILVALLGFVPGACAVTLVWIAHELRLARRARE